MRIRTYLALSNLALVLIVALGATIIALFSVERIAKKDLEAAEAAGREFAKANYQLTEKELTAYGEKLVEMQAEKAASELSHILGGRDSYDFDEMRNDGQLRAIGTQEIRTSEGIAGYITVGDKTGISVLHPNRSVEGKNFREWAQQYPKLWHYVERSFTEPEVKGYYSFVDRNNKSRKKYIVMIHIPRTPLTVGAVVNIDQYFLPIQRHMKQSQDQIMAAAKKSLRELSKETISNVKTVSTLGGGALLAGGMLFGLLIATLISRPIIRLRDGVIQIGKGDFTVEVPERGAKELKELAHEFNRLGKQLIEYIDKRDFIRDTFGRYITQEVANRLLESKDGLQLGGESREISLIMSDLRGFTSLTSSMSPEQVIQFLNRYLGKMVEIITDHRGVIDEIIGDGILAFFGAPDPLEDHPAKAVACALSMQAAMEEINKLNESDGLPHLEMGVAVNTGMVVVGNIGSEKRTKYGAVGAQVNFTGRIESYTVGGQVLISESTYLKLEDNLNIKESLHVEMKGMPGKVPLYDVRGIGEPYSISLPERHDEPKGLEHPIHVVLYRLEQKVVTEAGVKGWITHTSMASAIINISDQVVQWEDLKVVLTDKNLQPAGGEIYCKVVSVSPQDDGSRATVRFTSVSPEAYKRLRQLDSVS